MKNINVKIMGEGTVEAVALRLEEIAKKIRRGDHVENLDALGEEEWEDDTLFTSIKEL